MYASKIVTTIPRIIVTDSMHTPAPCLYHWWRHPPVFPSWPFSSWLFDCLFQCLFTVSSSKCSINLINLKTLFPDYLRASLFRQPLEWNPHIHCLLQMQPSVILWYTFFDEWGEKAKKWPINKNVYQPLKSIRPAISLSKWHWRMRALFLGRHWQPWRHLTTSKRAKSV